MSDIAASGGQLSLREAAALVGLSKDSLWLAVQRGELHSILGDGPSGPQYWLRREDVLVWNEYRRNRRGRSAPKAPSSPPMAPNSVPSVLHSIPSALDSAPLLGVSAPSLSSPSAVSAVSMPISAPDASDPAISGAENSAPSAHEEGPLGLADLRLALEVAAKTLDQNRELLEIKQSIEAQLELERERVAQEREKTARAERQAEELRYVLTQHQRALSEAAESLAEERARAMAAELAAQTPQLVDSREVLDGSLNENTRFLRTGRADRPGWGSRLRRWLLGERAVKKRTQ